MRLDVDVDRWFQDDPAMPYLCMTGARILLLGLLVASACADDKAPGFAPPPDVPDADGPDADAPVLDASEAGPEADAAADAETPLPLDGAVISECEGDVLEFEAAYGEGRAFTAAIRGNTMHLVYTVPSGGATLGQPAHQGLAYVTFKTSGVAEEPVDVVNVGVDIYYRTLDPSLVSRGEALDLFYTSNEQGSFELFYKELTSDGASSRQTENASNERHIASAAFGASTAVVYAEQPPAPDTPGAIALISAPSAASHVLLPASAGMRAAQLSLAQVGPPNRRRGVVGLVSDLDETAGIFVQLTDEGGQPSGDLLTLSDQVGAASSIAIASNGAQGAIVYTEVPAGGNHQLRFREVDSQGNLGRVVNLTSANQDLRELAIAPYSGGYVVAYRRVGGAPDAPASVHLLFVDAQGNRSGTRLVRAASLGGGGLSVLVANDGRLLVTWADTERVRLTDSETGEVEDETQRRVRSARLTCVVTNP